MSILHSLLNELKEEFISSENGKERRRLSEKRHFD